MKSQLFQNNIRQTNLKSSTFLFATEAQKITEFFSVSPCFSVATVDSLKATNVSHNQ